MKNSIDLLLEKNKEWILEKWLDRRLALFSNQKQSLIKTQMNQFQNPIRHEIHEGLKMILENFEEESEKFNEAVELICRVMAIQELPPSKSIAFFYELKEIVNDRVKKLEQNLTGKEFAEFNSNIEKMTLKTFDCYCGHREKIYQLKVDESKNKAYMLIKKAGL